MYFMSKRILFSILLVSIGVDVFSQQESVIQYCLPFNVIVPENLIYNRKHINPSLTNDTISFEASMIAHYQFIGYVNSPKNYVYSVGGKIPKTKNILGIDLGFEKNGRVQSQLLKINYSYRFTINERSDIKAGVNLGLARFKIISSNLDIQGNIGDPLFTSGFSNWGYQPIIDLGVLYRRKNQNIGLAYLGMIKSYIVSGFSKVLLTDRVIVFNYFSNYKLSNRLEIVPEIIVSNSISKTDIFLKGILLYREKFSAGMLIGSSSHYGFMLSCLFFRNVEMGYICELKKEPILNTYGYHTIKLGLILK